MAVMMVNTGRWAVAALGVAMMAGAGSGSASAQAAQAAAAAAAAAPRQAATPAPAAQPKPLKLQTLDPATRADPFPKVNPSNFTASSPTAETVNSYLHAVMGFDANRIWRVLAIQKTSAPGVTRVVAAISERAAGAKVLSAIFYVMPDGKHLIATDAQGGGVSPFGADPYKDNHAMVEARADGPAHGSDGKDLMLVEFTDLECPHCKEAQPTMDRLATDFPKARIVVESFPLVSVHPYAFEAAEYAVCVGQKSKDAFFAFEKAVFDTQSGLVAGKADDTLNAAATKAGADAPAVAACSKTPATKAAVDAQVKLGQDLGVDQTPTLIINGRLVPLGIPYETLRNLITFQAALDGVSAAAESPNPSGIPSEGQK